MSYQGIAKTLQKSILLKQQQLFHVAGDVKKKSMKNGQKSALRY
jgi:hypothetical protein